MVVDTKIIADYIELQEKIERLFDDGVLEKKRFADACGFVRQTLAKKLKDKSFSANDLLNLANQINKTLEIN
jgi:hypothetical protein